MPDYALSSNLVSQYPQSETRLGTAIIMTNFTVRRGAVLTLLAVLLSSATPMLRGQEAVSSTSSNLDTTTTTIQSAGGTKTTDLGTGIFSPLPFKVSFNVRGGYDDNVTTSNQFKQGSPFTNASVALTYDFGDPRTQLSLETGAGFTYYWDNISVPGVSEKDYDISTYLKLLVSHKVSPRLTLSMNDYLSYQTEPDFTIAQGLNRRGGNYFFTQDKFTANFEWAPRFATATSYTLGVLHYDDDNVGVFENHWENTFGNEFRFMLAPTTTLVAEYRFEIVTYDSIPRNSTTNFALGGFDHTFNPEVNVSVRGGVEFRSYEEGGDRTSPYFEGTLNYNVGKQTTLSWINRYAIEEPDTLLNQSRETFRTGIAAKHDFTAKISGTLGVYYEHDDYQSLDTPGGVVSTGFTEQSIDLALGLRYAITRYLGVEVGYNYTDVISDQALREYTRNRYWGGFNLTF